MTYELRAAAIADLEELKALDALCFPHDDPHRRPASPDEIEHGITNGSIVVATMEGTIAGFLHSETPAKHHAFIQALAVHPDHQRTGVGRELLGCFLAQFAKFDQREAMSVSTVTSPHNHGMLKLLLNNGFIVRRYVEDHYGDGQSRFYCQFKVKREHIDPDDRYLIPIGALSAIKRQMTEESYVITRICELPSGAHFELSRFEPEDFASLQGAEADMSVTATSGILASITFLLGFSFTGASELHDAVRLLLMAAAASTTISLVIYANTSGEMSRLRSNVFDTHMKWGNVLAEFGGMHPFLISMPVAFTSVSGNLAVTIMVAIAFSVGILAYELSRFSISQRYRQSWATHTLRTAAAFSPIAGVLAVEYNTAIWIWSALVFGVLGLLSVIYLNGYETGRGPYELGPAEISRFDES